MQPEKLNGEYFMQIEFIDIDSSGGVFTPKLGVTKDFERFMLVVELKLGLGKVDYSKGESLAPYVFSSILDLVSYCKKKFPDVVLFFTLDGNRIDFFKYLFGTGEGLKTFDILIKGKEGV